MPSSSQAKYAITYVLITSVVLLLLNFITAASTRNLVYQSNYTSMQDKVQLLSSSLSGLDSVTEEDWDGAALTRPVTVSQLHAWLAGHPGVFAAALSEPDIAGSK